MQALPKEIFALDSMLAPAQHQTNQSVKSLESLLEGCVVYRFMHAAACVQVADDIQVTPRLLRAPPRRIKANCSAASCFVAGSAPIACAETQRSHPHKSQTCQRTLSKASATCTTFVLWQFGPLFLVLCHSPYDFLFDGPSFFFGFCRVGGLMPDKSLTVTLLFPILVLGSACKAILSV